MDRHERIEKIQRIASYLLCAVIALGALFPLEMNLIGRLFPPPMFQSASASVSLTGDTTSCSLALGASEQGTISSTYCDITVTNSTGSTYNFNTYYLSPAQGTNFTAPPVYSASANYAVPLAELFIVYYSASANCATAHNCQAYVLAQANGPSTVVAAPGTVSVVTVTSVSTSVGTATYHYSSIAGPTPIVGGWQQITGFTNTSNNGTFVVGAIDTVGKTITANVHQVNETLAATGTITGGTTVNISSVAATTSAIYSYSSFTGPSPTVGATIVITGFNNGTNNGTFVIAAFDSVGQTITVSPQQIAETHAATSTFTYWVGPLNSLDAQPVSIMPESDAAPPTWGTDAQTCGSYPGGGNSDGVFVSGSINATLQIPQPVQHSISPGGTCHIHAYLLPSRSGTRTGNVHIVDVYGNTLSTISMTMTATAPNDKHNPTLPTDFNTDWPTNAGSYRQKTVCASGCDFTNLANALTDASSNCGTTGTMISVATGMVTTGLTTLPVNNCVDPAYVIIKSADIGTFGDGSHLPLQHNRVGNYLTLPDAAHMFTVETGNNPATIVMQCATGANHYRVAGMEATHTGGPLTSGSYLIITNTCSDHIILDRIYAHSPDINDSNPVDLTCNYCAVIDSYAYSQATGEIQAISVGGGGPGPIKVKNNDIIAAGENFMTGGGGQGIGNAHDIQLIGNHLWKPLSWDPHCQGSVATNYCGGVTWDGLTRTVKNLVEFKEGQKILVDGNIIEYNWGGYGQDGSAVLLTEGTNQAGGHPDSQSSDVTMSNNIIRHVGNGLNVIASNTFWIASVTAHVMIKNNLWNDVGSPAMEVCTTCTALSINFTGYSPHGYPTISYWATNASTPDYAKDLDFIHNDGLDYLGSLLEYGDSSPQTADSVNFLYNLVSTGTYGIGFSLDSCGGGNVAGRLNCIWPSNTFNNNVFIGSGFSGYPTGVAFAANTAAVGFSNYSAGESGTLNGFALLSSSTYAAGQSGQALDNTNMGIDEPTLATHTSCALLGQCATATIPFGSMHSGTTYQRGRIIHQ